MQGSSSPHTNHRGMRPVCFVGSPSMLTMSERTVSCIEENMRLVAISIELTARARKKIPRTLLWMALSST